MNVNPESEPISNARAWLMSERERLVAAVESCRVDARKKLAEFDREFPRIKEQV